MSESAHSDAKDAIVELEHVGLSFSQSRIWRSASYKVLDDLSLSIQPGETLGVIGRNGCGKSTLLRLIAGIYEPDQGRIIRRSANISLLSLSLGFDGALSGRDNAIICGMMLGNSKQTVVDKLDEIIDFSELNDFIDAPIRTYSSGMRARLGFSVAMTMQADLLLIDEVLGVGDTRFREKAIKSMRQKIVSDQTVVFVSHSERQIRALCDRVLWLDKGHTMQLGDADTVVSAYEAFLKQSAKLVV